VPEVAENEAGFTGCGKNRFWAALYQGTTLVVPIGALSEIRL
jgi:hypothetical protein